MKENSSGNEAELFLKWLKRDHVICLLWCLAIEAGLLSGIVFPEVFTTSAGEIQILFFLFMVFGGISFAEAINNFYCEILKFKNKSELQPLLKILYKKHVIFALLSIAIETGLVSVIYLRGVLALSEDEVQIISRFIAIAGGLTIAEVVNAFSIWRMLPAKVKKEKKVK